MIATIWANELLKLFNCPHCNGNDYGILRSDNQTKNGLYIINRQCLDIIKPKRLFYIGGTNQYYIIFIDDSVILSSDCDGSISYFPKIKISDSIYHGTSHRLFVSMISPETSTREFTNNIKRQIQTKLNLLEQIPVLSTPTTRYDLFDLYSSHEYYQLNQFFRHDEYSVKSDSYKLIYMNLECQIDIIQCAQYLSSNKLIYEIALSGDIKYEQPINSERINRNNSINNEYATAYIQNEDGHPVIWNHDLRGKNTIIGCADSGLDFQSCYFSDPSHEVLFSKSYTNDHRKIAKYNPYADKVDSFKGHGTHVVGTLCGDNLGKHNGISYGARVAFDDIARNYPDFVFDFPDDPVSELFLPSHKIGVNIHSDSWGMDKDKYDAQSAYIDDFLYEFPNFLIVAAVGNNGPYSSIQYPASCKNTLGVGATYSHDQYIDVPSSDLPLYVTFYSSRGPTPDNRIKPDIVAPGQGITSAQSSGSSIDTCNVFSDDGTSMATPLVSGATNLIYEYLVRGFYPSGSENKADAITYPTASLLKAMAIHSGRKIKGYTHDGISGKPSQENGYPSYVQGFGAMTLDHVLFFKDSSSPRSRLYIHDDFIDEETNYHIYNIQVLDRLNPLKVTLVWTDPPPHQLSLQSLVNDLDLRVQYEDGTVKFANSLSGIDIHNNVEQIWVNDVISTSLQVSIHSRQITFGQYYSLVVTGYFSEGSISIDKSHIDYIDPGDTQIYSSDGDSTIAIVSIVMGVIASILLLSVVYYYCGDKYCKDLQTRNRTDGKLKFSRNSPLLSDTI